MDQRKILWGAILTAVLIIGMVVYSAPRVGQAAAPVAAGNEPMLIRDLVDFPGDIRQTEYLSTDPLFDAQLTTLGGVAGVQQIFADADLKYSFAGATLADACKNAPTDCVVARSSGFLNTQPTPIQIELVHLSLQSTQPLATNGLQASVIVVADLLTPDPTDGWAGYVDGNLWPASRQPGTDPFIIVNAEPFFFVRFHWWAFNLLVPRIIWWDYWWHDSHNHPNWYWGVYWYWRVWLKFYGAWNPWYWYLWHWMYWHHWHWWSTWFPY